MKPTDPLFSKQWHLTRIGNIPRVWDEYSGEGVHIGVYDDGIQYTHPDLDNNYDPSRHVRFNGRTYDGVPSDVGFSINGHGTSVAGLIGAELDGRGTVGVAWGSSLTGINVFDPFSDLFIDALFPNGFLAAIAQSTRFDVVNHSWGSSPYFQPYQNLNLAGSFAAKVNARWAAVAAEGRDGLGTVIIKAAGNDDMHTNGDGLNASRFAVSVAAVRSDGLASAVSNHGANILVSAPAGESFWVEPEGRRLVTTDLLGSDGYDWGPYGTKSDYTDQIDGTSAAAPIVTGLVALMLDAAPGLGWRDVHDILATSATHTGDPIGRPNPPWPYDPYEDHDWFFNGADNWNGGGMHFSEDYGYGMVNAYNAVRMAEVWHLFTSVPQTSANEVARSTGRMTAGITIPDEGVATFRFTVDDPLELGSVSLTLALKDISFGDLDIFLVSPEGTQVVLKDTTNLFGDASAGLTWSFGAQAFRGEDSVGTWTLRIEDVIADPYPGGRLHWVDLDLHGRAPQTNDVYHYTGEFGAMAKLGGEAGRTLSDTDGGADWIDAAAIAGNTTVNLNAGATSTLGGGSCVIAPGTAIEHCVTGDGSDRVTGNGLANKL